MDIYLEGIKSLNFFHFSQKLIRFFNIFYNNNRRFTTTNNNSFNWHYIPFYGRNNRKTSIKTYTYMSRTTTWRN